MLQVIDDPPTVCRRCLHRVRRQIGTAMAEESFNASVYLVDRQVAAGRGDHLAVAGPAGSLTYAELADQVAALAAGLLGLGIRPEERVLLVMSDRPEIVREDLGLMAAGTPGKST